MRAPFAILLLLAACQTPADLLYQPAPDDPNDGYNSLPQAGVNTVMDWGPDQGSLLKEFSNLKTREAELQRRYTELLAAHNHLQGQLANANQSVQKEQSLRQQAEALVGELQKQRRELEAKVLSLCIEKAKLEQSGLVAEIDRLQRSLDQVPTPTEAAAPGGR